MFGCVALFSCGLRDDVVVYLAVDYEAMPWFTWLWIGCLDIWCVFADRQLGILLICTCLLVSSKDGHRVNIK